MYKMKIDLLAHCDNGQHMKNMITYDQKETKQQIKKKESDSMEILELLQWENEHKGTTYYEEGEDFEECEKKLRVII